MYRFLCEVDHQPSERHYRIGEQDPLTNWEADAIRLALEAGLIEQVTEDEKVEQTRRKARPSHASTRTAGAAVRERAFPKEDDDGKDHSKKR